MISSSSTIFSRQSGSTTTAAANDGCSTISPTGAGPGYSRGGASGPTRGGSPGAVRSRSLGGPPGLDELVERAVLGLVERGVQQSHGPPQVRELLQTRLPASLRQRLLNRVLSSGRLYNTVDMLMLEALLHRDIRQLSVRHVRQWYRKRFLLLLREHGVGLQRLQLEEIRVPADAEMTLARALDVMPQLTTVSLRFECDNAALWSLGRGCPNLTELNVEGSLAVTDLGVQTLCLRGATLPVPVPQQPACRQESPFTALYSMVERCLCFSQVNDEGSVIGVSWWRSSLMRRARRNACCATLLRINVTATNITRVKGLELLQSCCPQAHVIASPALITEKS